MDLQYGTIEITTKIGCPVNCSYCPQNKTVKAYKGDRVMTMDTLQACLKKIPIITNAKGDIAPRLEFSGFCEPFANPRCSDMVTWAYDYGFKNITLYTTLRGMKPEDVEKMKNVHFAFFSIHLPDTQNNIQVRVDADYLALLKLCIDTFPVCFFYSGDIKPEVFNVVKPYLDATPYRFYWNSVTHSRAGNVDGIPARERVKGHICCNSSEGMALNHNILLPNGDVSLCCMDFGLKHIVGNLLTDEYEDLFRSAEHNRVVAGMYVEDMDILCRHCDYAQPNTI